MTKKCKFFKKYIIRELKKFLLIKLRNHNKKKE